MTECIHKVQYYETDKMSIVHHSNYIRWFEEARIDWLEKAGCDMKTIEATGVLIQVLSVTCNYNSMVRFGDNVIVKTKVETFNGAKVVFNYEIVDESTGELRNTGSSTHCFIDESGKLISLKKYNVEMYEKLKQFVD